MHTIEFFDNAYRQFRRYWHHPNQDSTDPKDFSGPWARLLEELAKKPSGMALDLGAGEGSDAIRLARLGYEVDAVEGSAVGAEKIQRFARSAGVRVNVIHADVRDLVLPNAYDVVICNGLLHYLDREERSAALTRIKQLTAEGGHNLIFSFSTYGPIPDFHRIISVYPDDEDGAIVSSYAEWKHSVWLDRAKTDRSHDDFPSHSHSFVKVLAKKAIVPAS